MSIMARGWAVVVFALVSILVTAGLGIDAVRSDVTAQRRGVARVAVEEATAVVGHFQAEQAAGRLTKSQAQAAAASALQAMRFDGGNYVWINDTSAVMIMDPDALKLNGTSQWDTKDTDGVYPFREMVNVVRERGSGFVTYRWPKPGQEDPRPKVSYVAGYEPWSWIIGAGTYADDVHAVVWAQARKLGAVVAGMAAVLAGLGAFLGQALGRDVRLLVDGVSAIAAGDLSERRLPTGVDELGRIGSALQIARARLADQEQELLTATAQREQHLHTRFELQQQAARQIRERAQSVIDETAGTVAEELTAVVEQVGSVREGASTIDEKVAAAEEVTREVIAQAGQAEEVAGDLTRSLRAVAGMTKLIAGVADQTKMLALNATIEAARAGEAGQGFSVVANEVKELAGTTARSTDEITKTIAELERGAAAVRTTITRMSDRIGGLDDATAALAHVASTQRELVTSLDGTVTASIARVQGMSALSEQLERRLSTRVPAQGAATIEVDGQALPATLVEVGLGGLSLSLPASAASPLNSDQRATVHFSLQGSPTTLPASVRYLEPQGSDIRVGLEFENLPADVRTRLASMIDLA